MSVIIIIMIIVSIIQVVGIGAVEETLHSTGLGPDSSIKQLQEDASQPKIVSFNKRSGLNLENNDKIKNFDCERTGYPTADIQRLKDGEVINSQLTEKDNRSVHLICIEASEGEYSCETANIFEHASKIYCFNTEKDKKCPIVVIVSITVAIVLATISTLMIIAVWYLKMTIVIGGSINNKNQTVDNESSSSDKEIHDEALDLDHFEDDRDEYRKSETYPILAFDDNISISYEMGKNSFFINKNKLLGKGECGEVYGGFMDKFNGIVAFKSSKEQCSVLQMKALVSEFKILCHIGVQENIVSLLGAYTKEIRKGIFYMAFECCLGSLECYLRTNGNTFLKDYKEKSPRKRKEQSLRSPHYDKNYFDTTETLCRWCSEIANGMEYLENKRVIHLDLATRNILLKGDCTFWWKAVAKISDFGLSRQLQGDSSEYIKTGNEALPWRWLALESLQKNIYSFKTDVWSYGITVWEIFSIASIPYSGMSLSKDFIDELENGLRNGKPKFATEHIYQIMMQCWQSDPNKRPTFLYLKQFFQKVLTSTNVTSQIEETCKSGLKVNEYLTRDELDALMF